MELHHLGTTRPTRAAKPVGAIHSTKISGNFGPKLNGSVWSNQKSFEKTGPPFEVDHFSRSDRLEFWLNGSRPVLSWVDLFACSVETLNNLAIYIQGSCLYRCLNFPIENSIFFERPLVSLVAPPSKAKVPPVG